MQVNINEKELDELFSSNGVFQIMIDSFPLPVFYKDTNGVYRGCNDSFATFLGRKKEQIINKTVYDVSLPAKAKVYEEQDNNLFYGGNEIQVYESKVDGATETRTVRFYKARFRNAQSSNSVVGLIGIIVDITEEKNIEHELRLSLGRYRKLVESSDQGMIIFRNDEVIESNPLFSNLLGYEDGEILGRHVSSFFTPESYTNIEKQRIEDSETPTKVIAKKKNGRTLHAEVKESEVIWDGLGATMLIITEGTFGYKLDSNAKEKSNGNMNVKSYMSYILIMFTLAIMALWITTLIALCKIAPIMPNVTESGVLIIFSISLSMMCALLWYSHHVAVITLSEVAEKRLWYGLVVGILAAVVGMISNLFAT